MAFKPMPGPRVERCCDCGDSLGTSIQETLPGITREKRCVRCEGIVLVRHQLNLIPKPDEPGWDDFNDFEQEFLLSVRGQIARGKQVLSEKQIEVLDRIYRKR